MNQLIKMFCEIDDYCKEYEQNLKKLLNKNESKLKEIISKSSMVLSEIMTIAVHFYQSRIRNFKAYYKIMILGIEVPWYFYAYFSMLISSNSC